MTRWLHIVLLALCGLVQVGQAQAQSDFCAPLRGPKAQANVQQQATTASDVNLVQAGLRLVSGRRNGINGDGFAGSVTVGALADLCVKVPLAGATAVPGIVHLARNYGTILGRNENGPADLSDSTLLASAGDRAFNRRIVRFAGSAEMAKAALEGRAIGEETQCSGVAALDSAPEGIVLDDLKLVLNLLARADPSITIPNSLLREEGYGPRTQAAARAVCTLYPSGRASEEFFAAMVEFSAILASNRQAFEILGSEEFRVWVEQGAPPRLLRLIGTAPAVIALLQEFQRGEAEPPAPVVITEIPDEPPLECPAKENIASVTYFSLSLDEIAGLQARADIAETLAPFLAEPVATQAQLEQAVSKALGVVPGSCAAYKLNAILTEEPQETEMVVLDPQAVANLKLATELTGLLADVEALVGTEAADAEALQSSVQAAVEDSAGDQVQADIEKAAAVTAAAAEDTTPPPDFPAPELPLDVLEEPKPEQLEITDQSMKLIEAQVDNEAIVDVIEQLPEEPVDSREKIQQMVFDELILIKQDLVDAITDPAIAKLDTVKLTETQFRLTPRIVTRLQLQPEFAARPPVPEAAALILAGLQYPFQSLLESALVDAAPGEFYLTDRDALIDIARKTAAYGRRKVGPLGQDCGCVAARGENALIYAFWPFWLAEVQPQDPAPDAMAAEETPPEAESAVAQIDFGLVERVAFDGLVIGADGEIVNLERWKEAAPNFLHSAHKHQAGVDVAIRLRDWGLWTYAGDPFFDAGNQSCVDIGRCDVGHVNDITKNILSLFQPAAFPEDSGEDFWLERRMDRLLSRTPDGVTLILDFQRADLADDSVQMRPLIDLVVRLRDARPSEHFHINLAFDPRLKPQSNDGTGVVIADADGEAVFELSNDEIAETLTLFTSLKPILPGSGVERDDVPIITNVMLFLPRPTTEAKKLIRAALEGIFPGKQRVALLRSIIPVVPDGAHEAVFRRDKFEPFSQLTDDVIYFLDNFGGLGLWPSTTTGKEAAVRKEILEAVEIYQTRSGVEEEFSVLRVFDQLQVRMEPVCSYTCPRRMVTYFVMAVLTISIVGFSWLALYNGTMNRIANRYLVVPAMCLLLLALLMMTQICDNPVNAWAFWLFLALLTLIVAIISAQLYFRRVDGPKP